MMRERLFAIPAVKKAYDAKLAEDPSLANDNDKQRDFFRSVSRELNPFLLRPEAKTALDDLIGSLAGEDTEPGRSDGVME